MWERKKRIPGAARRRNGGYESPAGAGRVPGPGAGKQAAYKSPAVAWRVPGAGAGKQAAYQSRPDAGKSRRRKSSRERRARGSRHPPAASPLWRLAEALTDRFVKKPSGPGSVRSVNDDLLALCGGRKEEIRAWHVKKVHDLLCICLAVSAVGAVCLIAFAAEDRTIADGKIARPGYGKTSLTEDLVAQMEVPAGENEEAVSVEIRGKQYSSAQVRDLLEAAGEEAENSFLGSNRTGDEVREGLVFAKTYQNGAVKAEWTTMPYGILSDDGMPEEGIPEEGTVVNIEAELSCQGVKEIWERAVTVFPPVPDEAEQRRRAVMQAVEEADGRSAGEDYLELPDQIGGSKVLWSYAADTSLAWVFVMLAMVPFLYAAGKDQKVRDEAERRREQLERDYPDLMWKLTLLIGAGMNLSSAFARVAQDYEKERAGMGKHYVYEEMLLTCREIRDGMSEGTAYENFGRRCGLPHYVRIGSVLSQSLRKGTKGLGALLEQEALSTSQERRAQARKLGEKAGTKLLFPMIMMMGVVFVILMIPAFLQM